MIRILSNDMNTIINATEIGLQSKSEGRVSVEKHWYFLSYEMKS